MRVMLDANILISAAAYPSSSTERFMRLVTEHHRIVLCDYIINEFRDVVAKKFPDEADGAARFFQKIPFELVYTQKGGKELGVPVIRDIDDEPILATAIFEGVDVLVTGDKDFLSLELLEPKIMTMAEFMATFPL